MAHHKVFAGTFVLYIAILAFIAYIAFRPISESYLDADALDATTKSDGDAYSCNAEGGCFKNTSPTHFEVTLKEPTKRIKVHAAVDMVAPLTVNGSLVATAADVEKVRFPGPRGETGPQGIPGIPGIPGTSFDPSQTYELVQAKHMRVNRSADEQWPNGWGKGLHAWDVYANGTVGAGKDGTLAAYMNRDGIIMANNTFDLNAKREDKGIKAYHMTRTDEGNRYHGWAFWHMNDDYGRNDLQIWEYAADGGGNTCGGNSSDGAMCAPAFGIKSKGHVYTQRDLNVGGKLCINSTCLTESDMKRVKDTVDKSFVKGRYVRLQRKEWPPGGESQGYINILELSAIGRNGNVLKATASLWPQYGDVNVFGPNFVVDKDKRADWNSGGTGLPHTTNHPNAYIELDLGGTSDILSVVIDNRRDCCTTRIIGTELQILDTSRNIIWSKLITVDQGSYTFVL